MSAPVIADTRSNRARSELCLWSVNCPLGRHFDAVDSDEEDLMDASLLYVLTVGTA